MQRINRRKFLGVSAIGAGAALLGSTACTPTRMTGQTATSNGEPANTLFQEVLPKTEPNVTADEPTLVTLMGEAATKFQNVLTPEQQAKATYAFADAERTRWHWTTPRNFPRNGLPLREMDETQKTLALTLLQSSIAPAGFEKALNIMALQRDLGNDPELYYVTLFGAPGTAEPWGWRWEGHHLSHHFTVVNGQVAMTPFFLGSWPTTTEAGLRALPREEDAGLELINSLIRSGQITALFQSRTLTNHVTQNAPKVTPLEPVGVLVGDMNDSQQPLVTEIVQTYLRSLPEHVAAPLLAEITATGLAETRFGWAGSLEHRQPQYYRLQGPSFLLEFDNSRNGGTHIHSVWRDFTRDFGYHLL
ncbi:MAG: DUF3500 domain-containing protein [Caldilineaceae bacterium]